MILSLERQTALRNAWLHTRLETILPELLDRAGIDLWLVCAREYNEDPVLFSLLPQPAMGARRRTLLAFVRTATGVDCLSLDRYGYPGYYQQLWTPSAESQAEALTRLIRDRDPAKIGINTSDTFAFADGLSQGQYQWLIGALGAYAERLVSAESVCVGWLERRLPEEIIAYNGIVQLAHELIRETFTPAVIHPGVTTTADVVWYLRERMQAMGVRAWFHPTVELQAPGLSFAIAPGMDKTPPRTVIQPGDLLHVDVGFSYLGLTTDHQQHTYLLRPGESDAPEGLQRALAIGNRLQDILMSEMRVGLTGNEVLRAALAQAQIEQIDAQIYSHPIGTHGHAAGPTIGLWDQQQGVAGGGDYPLYDHTCYSIELNIRTPLAEWGDQEVRIALEEDAVLQNGVMRWLDGRQTAFHRI
jgi:Xaa-Pro aminopeptidase